MRVCGWHFSIWGKVPGASRVVVGEERNPQHPHSAVLLRLIENEKIPSKSPFNWPSFWFLSVSYCSLTFNPFYHSQFVNKPLKLNRSQWLDQLVSNHLSSWFEFQFNDSLTDEIACVIIFYGDMFRSFLKNEIVDKLYCSLIVCVDDRWIFVWHCRLNAHLI